MEERLERYFNESHNIIVNVMLNKIPYKAGLRMIEKLKSDFKITQRDIETINRWVEENVQNRSV